MVLWDFMSRQLTPSLIQSETRAIEGENGGLLLIKNLFFAQSVYINFVLKSVVQKRAPLAICTQQKNRTICRNRQTQQIFSKNKHNYQSAQTNTTNKLHKITDTTNKVQKQTTISGMQRTCEVSPTRSPV